MAAAATLVPADRLSPAELADAFTAGYEGYVVRLAVDTAAVEFMVAAYDLDLARSRIALRDGRPVGLALLGVRGTRGWVGGLGVVPSERRGGLGLALMEALLAE